GYRLDEIVGRHHSTLVPPEQAASREFVQFWNDLRAGHAQTAEYQRLGKNGKEFWVKASYHPIFDPHGRPFKVVGFAVDTTSDKIRTADFEGQVAAINKSQSVVEFGLDGTILTANDNFLTAMGYR